MSDIPPSVHNFAKGVEHGFNMFIDFPLRIKLHEIEEAPDGVDWEFQVIYTIASFDDPIPDPDEWHSEGTIEGEIIQFYVGAQHIQIRSTAQDWSIFNADDAVGECIAIGVQQGTQKLPSE